MGKQEIDSLFMMDDFRPYIRAWARARGRGEFRRISKALEIHTTLVSQIMSGRKCLTEDQASRLCRYMALNPLETDYFLKLVQLERAGTEFLRQTYRRHLNELRAVSTEVKSRIPAAMELSEQDRALFYSSWQYGLVRLLTSIKDFQTKEQIAFRLGLSISRVQEILDFLATRGLCEERNGKYKRTEKNTHVEAGSALVTRHHQNWRARALDLLERKSSDDFAFTSPVALAKADIPKVREILLKAVSDISKVIEASPSEDISYLAIDWLRI